MKLIAQYRITIAYLLLIAFSLVALPKELWHSDAHQIFHFDTKHQAETNISASVDECSICSLHITAYVVPTLKQKRLEYEVRLKPISLQYAAQELSLSSTQRLRGPPQA